MFDRKKKNGACEVRDHVFHYYLPLRTFWTFVKSWGEVKKYNLVKKRKRRLYCELVVIVIVM